ncbi:MAG: hypothetical protein ACRET3_13825, partial [Burkholderiales bacterium]
PVRLVKPGLTLDLPGRSGDGYRFRPSLRPEGRAMHYKHTPIRCGVMTAASSSLEPAAKKL